MSLPESNGKTVLVTGIGGYIAGVLGHLLLTKGYTVRGTTRHAASLDRLLKGPYAPYADRFKIYEVPNMAVDGAFDEAAKGVDGIFHTASPVDFTLKTYDDFVLPAIRGNETLLASALKAGPQLSSVIVTSSMAAIFDPKDDHEYVYTEADHATAALTQAQKDKETGAVTPVGVLYQASKTAADQTMWKYRDFHKPPFAITTINPGVVIGPLLLLPLSGEKLNQTLLLIYRMLAGTLDTVPPNFGSRSIVHVRDVAFEHVWAFEHPSEADGQRYIACSGYGPYQASADIMRETYKGTAIGDKITVGNPGETYDGYDPATGVVADFTWPKGGIRVDGSKAEKAMGFKYIPFKQSVIDTAKALEPLL